MTEKGYYKKLLLGAFSWMAMMSVVEANMVFYDGFTIELPVWFELIPRLRPPLMGPYKETSGQTNGVSNGVQIPGPPQYQGSPNRLSQLDYNQQQGYSNVIQIQPKPIQFPGPQYNNAPQYPRTPDIIYRPPPRPAVIYTAPTTTTTAPTTTVATDRIPPAAEDEEDEYPEENPESY